MDVNKDAQRVFARVAPDFAKKLEIIAHFLNQNPELAPKPGIGDEFGTEKYWERIADKFLRGRNPRAPQEPATIPDHMVGIILQEYFGLDHDSISKTVKEHSLSMAAENIVGDLLERYLASVLEPFNWVWCSGEVVKRVDFIALRDEEPFTLVPLQIKNRDNSENSSSSSVRHGTDIIKWFRTFSRTGATNWDAFPENAHNLELSEIEFEKFARQYLRTLSV